jgi:predicted enzyme related to lactoylglutathione lyase
MKVNSVYVQISSSDPQRLQKFYSDVVGLPPQPDSGEGALNMGGTTLGFDAHSDIGSPTKEPARVLLDLFVDDVAAEQSRLEKAGVRFIRTQGREPWGGIISTFVDPDGNYCQLIEYKPQ